MTRASDIMSTPARSIGPQESLRRAAALMSELDVGSLPVCHDRILLGMITDRDITTRGVANGLSPDTHHVSDVMSPSAVCCSSEDDLDTVMRTMSDNQLRRLPVLDGDKRLVGIVALADVARAAQPLSQDEPEVGATVRDISQPGPQ